jgi:hypothetical protein
VRRCRWLPRSFGCVSALPRGSDVIRNPRDAYTRTLLEAVPNPFQQVL